MKEWWLEELVRTQGWLFKLLEVQEIGNGPVDYWFWKGWHKFWKPNSQNYHPWKVVIAMCSILCQQKNVSDRFTACYSKDKSWDLFRGRKVELFDNIAKALSNLYLKWSNAVSFTRPFNFDCQMTAALGGAFGIDWKVDLDNHRIKGTFSLRS